MVFVSVWHYRVKYYVIILTFPITQGHTQLVAYSFGTPCVSLLIKSGSAKNVCGSVRKL